MLQYFSDNDEFTLTKDRLHLRFLIKKNSCTLFYDRFEISQLPFVSAELEGRTVFPTSASYKDGCIVSRFDDGEVKIKVDMYEDCARFKIVSCPDSFERLKFAGVFCPEHGNEYTSVGMALNSHTNSSDLLSASETTHAECYREFGVDGGAFAVLLCKPERLRECMKWVTSNLTEDIPWSKKGGAYAADNSDVRSSYLMNTTGIDIDSTDDWICAVKRFGASQLDFHGGSTFRFGDFKLNESCFPRGRDDFREIIDRLHSAGIQAGLHTYAQFIDPHSEFVTPIPNPGLGGEYFTLVADVDDSATEITTVESTSEVSTLTGFFVRNSVYLVIDNEIIRFGEVGDNKFAACERGALNTNAAAHAAGAKVKHLHSVFGLFCADKDSDLYLEIARRTAEFYNDLGFDMIYLDAIDGSDIFAGYEKAWYYANRFVAEIMKNANRPPILEMSQMWHHFWYYRSRMGAWDHSRRAHKFLLSQHDRSNQRIRAATTLPQNFGWWCYPHVDPNDPIQTRRMFADDYEYFGYRSLCGDWSLSFIVGGCKLCDELARFSDIISGYEELRHNLPAGVQPHDRGEAIMRDGVPVPTKYKKYRLYSKAPNSFTLAADEKLERLRIENRPFASITAEPSVLLSASDDFGKIKLWSSTNVMTSVSADTDSDGKDAIRINAKQDGANGYARIDRVYEPTLNLGGCKGIGVYIHGDGKGEKLDFQLRSPKYTNSGLLDRIVDIDFVGWKYFELIESDAERTSEDAWPFSGGGHYNAAKQDSIFRIAQDIPHSQYEWHPSSTDADLYQVVRESISFANIYSLSVWLNHLPDGEECSVTIGDIAALPLEKAPLERLTLTVNGCDYEIGSLPVDSYLEYDGGSWLAYDADGSLIRDIKIPSELTERLADARELSVAADGDWGLELTVGTSER